MAKCMNKYLSDKSYKAVEISGKSLEYLSGKYVAQGQPIMVWATINMSPSFKTTTWRVNYTDENAKYKLGSYYTWTAGERVCCSRAMTKIITISTTHGQTLVQDTQKPCKYKI